MSENCNHNCEGCQADCGSRKADFKQPANKYSHIKKVIGVVSGKGGVGKSLVTSMLAVLLNRRGYHTAVLDADITGPSIPKVFGVKERAKAIPAGMLPSRTKTGVAIMSINLLLNDETEPVVWRGPIIAGAVKQFWTDVIWEDVDYMFVDMPPGTGDVPLTVFQSIPLDGIVIVASPQELVGMIVEKAVNMAKTMNIPIVGVVENMSYVECPDCGKKLYVFGESHLEEAAAKHGLKVLGRLPLNPEIAKLCDAGDIESFAGGWLDGAADAVEAR